MRRPAFTIIMAAAIAMTAGCAAQSTPSPAPDGDLPAVHDACIEFRTPVEAAGAAVSNATAELYDDPAGAATQLSRAALAFADAASAIGNDELRDAAEPIGDAMSHLADGITAHAADPSEDTAGAILDITREIDDQFALIDEMCA